MASIFFSSGRYILLELLEWILLKVEKSLKKNMS